MITMQDIATRAGVAQSTVSYILNQRHAEMGISATTCERVQQAASELGYRPNRIARAMVTGKNHVLGLVVRYPEYEQVGYMLWGALQEADEAGYSLKVLQCRESVDVACIESCVELRLAGVISLHVAPEMLARFNDEAARYSIPFVALDSSFSQSAGARVISDDDKGIAEAVRYLHELGHRRMALITVGNDGAAMLRQQGFCQTIQSLERDAPIRIADVKGYWNDDEVEAATRALLENEADRPTAILCVGDAMALVAMRTAKRMGLKIPGDLSVMGYSDLAMAKRADPPLSTVAQPFREMGRAAVRCLLQTRLATDGEGAIIEERLATQLVVRESTGPPPKA